MSVAPLAAALASSRFASAGAEALAWDLVPVFVALPVALTPLLPLATRAATRELTMVA
jgi:hypothetical protein